MSRAVLARTLLVVAIVYVLAFYFIGAAIKPGYSQVSDFVSEYNASGTAWAGLLTYAGFLGSTLVISAFLMAAAPVVQVRGTSRVGYWLLWALPASYLVGAVAPCDLGCPPEGSASQLAHNIGSVLTYFGMGAGVALVSRAPGFAPHRGRRLFLLSTGIAFPVVFFAMVDAGLAPWSGLLQRSLDAAMAVCLVFVAWTLTPGGAARVAGRDEPGADQAGTVSPAGGD